MIDFMPDAHIDLVLRACNSALHLLAGDSELRRLGLHTVAAGESNLPPVGPGPCPLAVAVAPVVAKRARGADGSLEARIAVSVRGPSKEAVKALGPDLFAANPRGPVVAALEKAAPAKDGFVVTGMRGVPLVKAVAVTRTGNLARAGESASYFQTLLVVEITCTA